MTGPGASTVVHAFAAAVATDATRPLITFYDDATGERVELSGATLANWVAKTANLLVDGMGLGPGQVAAVRLPPHWQTAAILLGCWSAGLTVDLAGSAPADVAFVSADVDPRPAADETYALSLATLGLPFRPGPPPGTVDFAVEVRGYGDFFPGNAARPDQAALDGSTHADLLQTGARAVPAGARVLIDGDANPDPRSWLVAPLAAGASVVLCRHLDPAKLGARLATERAQLWPPAGQSTQD
jgi:uncharacterized protein (TIGR03089 family)